jgi:hypothetical protein
MKQWMTGETAVENRIQNRIQKFKLSGKLCQIWIDRQTSQLNFSTTTDTLDLKLGRDMEDTQENTMDMDWGSDSLKLDTLPQ